MQALDRSATRTTFSITFAYTTEAEAVALDRGHRRGRHVPWGLMHRLHRRSRAHSIGDHRTSYADDNPESISGAAREAKESWTGEPAGNVQNQVQHRSQHGFGLSHA